MCFFVSFILGVNGFYIYGSYDFCWKSDEIADSIRTFAQLDGRKPLLAIVDVGERRTYSLQEENITRETIDDLVSKFKNCSLDFVPMGD